jgi:hypothetical protein
MIIMQGLYLAKRKTEEEKVACGSNSYEYASGRGLSALIGVMPITRQRGFETLLASDF